MGLRRELGSVEPSTTSGHPVAGPARSSWGLAPLHQLGCRRGPACGCMAVVCWMACLSRG